jgi:hypothetical protein
MRKIISLALAAFIIAPAVMAEGEVYRWKDGNGVWHYSDQPQPGAELVKTPGTRSSSANTSSASTYAPTPAAAPDDGIPPLSREATQQVRQEAAKAKDEQCKKATEAYQSAITARRLYKEDDKGNRTFLSSAEIDAARLKARSTRDIACGPTP